VLVDWRDFEEMTSRHEGKQEVLDDLLETWSNCIVSVQFQECVARFCDISV